MPNPKLSVTVYIVFLMLSVMPVSVATKLNAAAESSQTELATWVEKLDNSKTAKDAIANIVARIEANRDEREDLVETLVTTAKSDKSITRRGWAISCLAEIGGQDIDEQLLAIHASDKHSMLIRTWAAAARISMTRSAEALVEKAQLIHKFPALERPIGMRLVNRLNDGASVSVDKLLSTTLRVPTLQQALAPAILAQGPESLADALINANDQAVRRQAAAYLGTLTAQGDTTVPSHVIKVYTFHPSAKEPVWQGGPLFLPGIAWPQAEARTLVGNLIAWHLWCDRNGRNEEKQQIHNNLRSLSLAKAAGYQSPGFQAADTIAWLKVWGRAVGKDQLRAILAAQGVENHDKYRPALTDL